MRFSSGFFLAEIFDLNKEFSSFYGLFGIFIVIFLGIFWDFL